MTFWRTGFIAAIMALPACAAAPPAFAPDPDAPEVVIPGDPYLSRVATRWFRDGDETRLVKLEAAAADAAARCRAPDWRKDFTPDACAEMRKLDRTVKAIRASATPADLEKRLSR